MRTTEAISEIPNYYLSSSRDYQARYAIADEGWMHGVEVEKQLGMAAAAPLYEGALMNYIGAVWWHKDPSDQERDHIFSLKLAEVQTKLAGYSGLRPGDGYIRRESLFEAAEHSYSRALKLLDKRADEHDPHTTKSLEALILSRRVDMNTARGHFIDANKDLDLAEEDIGPSSTDTISDSMIRAQIIVQRAVIQQAEGRKAKKATPKTPADFLLELVSNTELAAV